MADCSSGRITHNHEAASKVAVADENGVLHHRQRPADPDADTTINLTRGFLLRLVTKQAGLKDMIFSDQGNVDSSRLKLLKFFSLLQTPDANFNIVTL